MPTDLIVSTQWLSDHLHDPTIRVIDCRGYVSTRAIAPGVEEADYLGAEQEYLAKHIPGAVYVDWTKDVIDPSDPVPVQIAPPEVFATAMSSRGIGNKSHVICVDHMGGQFATRLWWDLRYYGHEAVSVLEGGWNRWVEEDRPTESGPVHPAIAEFVPRIQPALRKTAEQVRDLLGSKNVQLLDARDAGQFSAAKRRGPRGGHIPGAIHVPRELFFAEVGGFVPLNIIQDHLDNRGVDRQKPIVAYCNGGVAATVVLFNLARLGRLDWSNYDGSWNEWSAKLDLPVEA